MRNILIILSLVMLHAPVWAADPVPFDPETLRLQTAEAAIRAGVSRPQPQAIIRKAPSSVAPGANGDHVLLLHRESAPRAFPMPQRAEVQRSSAGMRAMIDASQAASSPPHASTPTVVAQKTDATAGAATAAH